MTPGLSFAFEARFTLSPALDAGEGADGRHRVIPILGGAVEGPRLQGTVLPGGADWQRIRPDGLAVIEARYVIQAADGAIITVVNRGLRHGPPAVMKRLAAGQPVDSSEYYFRTAPRFQTGEGSHAWMERSLFVGSGHRLPSEVVIRFFTVD